MLNYLGKGIYRICCRIFKKGYMIVYFEDRVGRIFIYRGRKYGIALSTSVHPYGRYAITDLATGQIVVYCNTLKGVESALEEQYSNSYLEEKYRDPVYEVMVRMFQKALKEGGVYS